MNIPSHYQSALFHALAARVDVDLQVRYFQGVDAGRAAEGWNAQFDCEPFEQVLGGNWTSSGLAETLPDYAERIHLISSNFHQELVQAFSEQNIPWCHWSEMPGIRLAEKVGYRMSLFRLLNPLMLRMKHGEGRLIARHALGAFGQGKLAREAFQAMGVPADKTADLYYTPAALRDSSTAEAVSSFASGRRVFLAVGALCYRKGIDVLLKAFAQLETDEWCLVLCGLDRENGRYEKLAEKLGIAEQVCFLGAYPAEKIGEVYAASDVFVLPSRFDGWGAVLNEAASVGLPVIGTDLCGGAWHVVVPGKTGARARAGSANSLHTAMATYVDQPGLIAQHGAAAKRWFQQEFSPEANAQRLLTTLEDWV